jgi:lipoate synthase
MSSQYDIGIIFDMPVMRESTDGQVERNRQSSRIMRTLAPFALHETLIEHGIHSTLINYSNSWDADVLYSTLSAWLDKHRAKNVLILASTLFSVGVFDDEYSSTRVIKRLQREYNCTLVLGGPALHINQHIKSMHIDAVFQGRSLHLFKKWLVGEPIDLTKTKIVNGVQLFAPNSNVVVEEPIVPTLYDDYCLNHKDIVHFETRLGCKFNCTFCSFEYRNAKQVNDSSAEKLATLFQSAKDRYGITRFSCVDDTFNEEQVKIDTLHCAVKSLDYKPSIVGYSRFDVMMAKPEQIQQLDECGFTYHQFGIETFHREASKLIRKGMRKERAFDFLQYLRDNYPHWWLSSGYIVGVPLEPIGHIMDTLKEIRERKLMDGLAVQRLGVYQAPGHEQTLSDFSKNPQQFGITILDSSKIDQDWRHSEMDRATAITLTNRLIIKNNRGGLPEDDAWEALCRTSCPDRESAEQHIENYIQQKISFLGK